MTTHFFLAPNARWMGRDQVGNPIINGRLFTYQSGTSTRKATYEDYLGESPNSNPVELDGAGEANIYWKDDEYYRIVLVDEDGNEVYDQDPYPYVLNNNASPSIDVSNVRNIVRNQQFSFWTNGTSFPNISTQLNNYDFIADDWLFAKTDADSVVNISRVAFTPGESNEISYAPFYLQYECSSIGSGTETNANIYQRYESAGTFSNSSVSLTFTARVGSGYLSGSVTPHLWQNFGTGGSPSASVDNFLESVNLTSAWQTFTQTIPVDSIGGKTLGTNGDDSLQLSFQAPSNVLTKIHIQSVQLTPTPTAQPYQFESQNDQYVKLYRNTNALFQTGDYKHTISTTNDPGWVLCNNQTIGNAASNSAVAGTFTKALFKKLYASALNLYCPIFNSDGTNGTRTTAEADYNANKQLLLTLTLGRVLAGANPTAAANSDQYFNGATAVNVGGNYIQLADDSSFYTGTIFTFGAGGVLPTTTPQIVAGTQYYAINLGGGLKRIQLATTLAIAIAGTPNITINVVGSGIIAAGVFGTSTPMCSTAGEEYHGLVTGELSVHTHANAPTASAPVITPQVLRIGIAGPTGSGQSIVSDDPLLGNPLTLIASAPTITANNAAAGTSLLHNNIQPTLFINIMLKL